MRPGGPLLARGPQVGNHWAICSMFRAELHKTANRKRFAGTHYVDGMMLLRWLVVAEVAGVIEPLKTWRKKVVLEMFSNCRETCDR